MCAAWCRCGTLRDAAGAADSRSSYGGFRGVGVLELAEVGEREYGSVAAERRDAPCGIFAARDCPRMRGSGGARAGRGPRGVRVSRDGHNLAETRILVRREEVSAVDETGAITIVATGPLTSDALAAEIARLSTAPTSDSISAAEQHAPHLYFYDSISPIVEADSIDMDRVYMAARYDKGSADYINCPMTREEYDRFYDALLAAQSVEERDWEKLNYFESCLPIEEIARRGRDTLRFGPMKPVGLKDPRTGRMPYAVVQLRQENLRADSYNLVGFQNHLKFGEQARVLRMIPGLENARFLRYGQIHRNTYINSPTLLNETLQMKENPNVMFAGQICGVEGYVESIATGLLAGMHAATLATGGTPVPPPRATAFGSLVHYISRAE